MQITEIKIGGLLDFIKSEQFKLFNPKPITVLRAISQFNNPDAKADDTALIIAHDNSEVIGFAGFLPRNTNESNLHVCSNTCWWVNPQKGRSVALPLLFSGMKKYDMRMYLTDSTSHSKSILEKTGLFNFSEPHEGIRGIMRFYFADLITKKYGKLKIVNFLFVFIDFVLNFLWSPVRYYYKKKYSKYKLEFKPVTKIDSETEKFIKAHSKKEFINKSSAVLEWMKEYPWVVESKEKEPYEYPFSHLVEKYKLDYFELKKSGELKAFVAISVRDNLVKIPFIYFEDKVLKEVLSTVFWYILKNKYDSIIVFHPAIISFFKNNKLPFIYKKNEFKRAGTTNILNINIAEKPIFQDGDGDVVFT